MRYAVLLFLVVFLVPALAMAQQGGKDAPLPETLKNLAERGAQVRYLGREKGLDGWITVFQGQEQYFYATPDGEAILMGLLFDKNGKMLTVRQVQNLQQGNDPTLESLITQQAAPEGEDALRALQESFKKQRVESPAEQMFSEIESANWFAMGPETAPAVYAFLDPQCAHCHEFMKDIARDYVDGGQIQLRVVPVGFRDDSRAQAAFLLASPDAAERWKRHLSGDESALPVSSDVNTQAIEANMSIMQNWKLDATPMIVYRSNKGDVKIVRGRPRNFSEIMIDIY